jgi:hypothetical protein
VRAYRRQPAVEVPLQFWMNFPPYEQAKARKGILSALNRLMPKGEQFAVDRADLRPNLPLVRALAAADHAEQFQQIMGNIITRLHNGA